MSEKLFTKIWGPVSKAAVGVSQIRAARSHMADLEFNQNNNISGTAHIAGAFSKVIIKDEEEIEVGRLRAYIVKYVDHATAPTEKARYRKAETSRSEFTDSIYTGIPSYKYYELTTFRAHVYQTSAVSGDQSCYMTNGNSSAPYETIKSITVNGLTINVYRSKQFNYAHFGVRKKGKDFAGWGTWIHGEGLAAAILGTRPSTGAKILLAIYPHNSTSTNTTYGAKRRDLRMFVTDNGDFASGTTYILPDPTGEESRDLDVGGHGVVPDAGVMVFLAVARMTSKDVASDGTFPTFTSSDHPKLYVGIMYDWGESMAWIGGGSVLPSTYTTPPDVTSPMLMPGEWHSYSTDSPQVPATLDSRFHWTMFPQWQFDAFLFASALVPISKTKVLWLMNYYTDSTKTVCLPVMKIIDIPNATITELPSTPFPAAFYTQTSLAGLDVGDYWNAGRGLHVDVKQRRLRDGVLLLKVHNSRGRMVNDGSVVFETVPEVVFLRTVDNGDNWALVSPTGLPANVFTDARNSGSVFTVVNNTPHINPTVTEIVLPVYEDGKYVLYRSVDDGSTWKKQANTIVTSDWYADVDSSSQSTFLSDGAIGDPELFGTYIPTLYPFARQDAIADGNGPVAARIGLSWQGDNYDGPTLGIADVYGI